MVKSPPFSSVDPGPDGTVTEPAELPESVPDPLPQGRVLCGNLNIRIDRDGVWHYEGQEIQRKELVCLFASVLVRDAAGAFWLVTPAEICGVLVEDAPFVAVEAFLAGEGEAQMLSVRTNVDEMVTIDADHPLHVRVDPKTGEALPYVTVREGIEARLSRPVYYELVEWGVERRLGGRNQLGVWSCGTFFVLGNLDDD